MRLGWRGGSLLARFDCRHDGVTATLRGNNAPLWTEDVVEAFVAVGEAPAPAGYFEFEVNPLSARFSARVQSPNLSREGMRVETFECPGFTARVRIREKVWSALLSLPLEALAGGAVTALHGNFFRIDRKSGEFQALFPTMADPPDFHRPGAFGLFSVQPAAADG